MDKLITSLNPVSFYLIKINDEQKDWLKNNFALSKRDLPSPFFNRKELIEMLNGNNHFVSYLYGEKDDIPYIFHCTCMVYATKNRKKDNLLKFNNLLNQLFYLSNECRKLEYYELLGNIHDMMISLRKFEELWNKKYVEDQISSLKIELNLS